MFLLQNKKAHHSVFWDCQETVSEFKTAFTTASHLQCCLGRRLTGFWNTAIVYCSLLYLLSLFRQMWKDSRWYAVKLWDGNELHLFDLVALMFPGRPLFLRGGWCICLPALNCHLSSSEDNAKSQIHQFQSNRSWLRWFMVFVLPNDEAN